VACGLPRTQDWLERCASSHNRADQACSAIVQGVLSPLRETNPQGRGAMDLPGIADAGQRREAVRKSTDVAQVTPLPAEQQHLATDGTAACAKWRSAVARIDPVRLAPPTRLDATATALVRAERWNLAMPASHDHTP